MLDMHMSFNLDHGLKLSVQVRKLWLRDIGDVVRGHSALEALSEVLSCPSSEGSALSAVS